MNNIEPEKELKYCQSCIQMTNHLEDKCLKCQEKKDVWEELKFRLSNVVELNSTGAFSKEALLSPDFWKCAGKVLGWGPNKECNRCGIHINGWKAYQHRFIDHLQDHKDPEEFFKNLLK